MPFLTKEENERIRKAVADAEKHTGGEIVTAIIPESDNYSAEEIVFGISAGLLAYIGLVIFAKDFQMFLDRLFWTDWPALYPLGIMAVTLFVGVLFYSLAQIPSIDRLIIGKKNMSEMVRRRAMRHFAESAVHQTIDRTGVLLFISILERRVELIADSGIDQQVEKGAWDKIVQELVEGIKANNTAESIEVAIKKIGELLALHVQRRQDDSNEIPDGPTELEKGS